MSGTVSPVVLTTGTPAEGPAPSPDNGTLSAVVLKTMKVVGFSAATANCPQEVGRVKRNWAWRMNGMPDWFLKSAVSIAQLRLPMNSVHTWPNRNGP